MPAPLTAHDNRRPLLAISSCLLGEAVRYDGGHKRDTYITRTLSRHFEWRPVCPEVGIGLGVPRPPIQLVGRSAAPRAVGVEDARLDVTDRLSSYAERKARGLTHVCGYILKGKSPSCGLTDVKLFGRRGLKKYPTSGLYARGIRGHLPWLPLIDEYRLHQDEMRDAFLEQVFFCSAWQNLCRRRVSGAGARDFLASYRLVLTLHSPRRYRALQREFSALPERPSAEVLEQHLYACMTALRIPASRQKHGRIMNAVLFSMRSRLGNREWLMARQSIEVYCRGDQSRVKTIKLIRRLARRAQSKDLLAQKYLFPEQSEWVLRFGT